MTSILIRFYCAQFMLLEKKDPHDERKPPNFSTHLEDKAIGFVLSERRPLFFIKLRHRQCPVVALVLCLPAKRQGGRARGDLEHITHARQAATRGAPELGAPCRGSRAGGDKAAGWNVSTRRDCPFRIRDCSRARAPLAGARPGSGFEARRLSGKSVDSSRGWIRPMWDKGVQRTQ